MYDSLESEGREDGGDGGDYHYPGSREHLSCRWQASFSFLVLEFMHLLYLFETVVSTMTMEDVTCRTSSVPLSPSDSDMSHER